MKRVESFETLRRRQRIFWCFAGVALALFLAAELLTSFLFENYMIASSSMNPLLSKGNCILASPAAYSIQLPFVDAKRSFYKQPARGDVVMLDPPAAPVFGFFDRLMDRLFRFFSLQQKGWKHSNDPLNRPLVKRIIAAPGDTIRIENYIVYIKPEGSAHFLTEHEVSEKVYDVLRDTKAPGWNPDLPFSGSMSEYTLKADEYFVLNDNRLHSNDSRYFGVVSSSVIRGRVLLRYWPLHRFRFF